MTPQHSFRRRGARYPYPYPVAASYPDTVVVDGSDCQCNAGSDIERKIKENPLVVVVAALFVGWLLGKKH